MCAYNAVNGDPACASGPLLQRALKDDWQFDGFVVSDCGAVNDIVDGHKAAADLPHASARSLKAGTDLSCGKEYASLAAAVKQGLVSEREIDAALARLLTARFRLGMFDPAASVPFNAIPFSENDSPEHARFALEAARASMMSRPLDVSSLEL